MSGGRHFGELPREPVVVLVAVLLVACGEAADTGGELSVTSTVLAPDRVIRSGPVQEPGTPWELFRPVDIAAVGDSVLIADSGNDRIVLLDGSFRFVRAMGREGSGPGEFRASFTVRWTGHDVIVSDLGNGRISWLSPEGESRATLAVSPLPQSFDVLADGTLLLPSRSGTHYLERIDGEQRQAFAERPDTLVGGELKSARVGSRDVWVAVTAGDTVHIFDDATGELSKIAPDGRRRMIRSLPRTLLDSMRTRRSRAIEGFAKQGIHVWQWPLAKGFNLTDDGRLLLLLHNGATAGFVIDPHTYVAMRIIVPPGSPKSQPLLNASRAVLRGQRMTILNADSLIDYRMSEVPG